MTSFHAPQHHHFLKNFANFFNPDICTSAGIVATTYGQFKTTFWIDRILIVLNIWIPLGQAVLLLALHTVIGVTRCLPQKESNAGDQIVSNSFIDRACGLQLTSDVLRGDIKTVPTSIKPLRFVGHQVSSELSTIRLQHECYPFVLLIVAIIMWIPHFLYHRATDNTARRDLCLVRSELHSFRRAITQELAYLQTVATASTEVGAPTNAFFSPESTIPQFHHQPTLFYAYNELAQQEANSCRTTGATIGGTSGFSQTPAPTVIHAQRPQMHTLGTTRCGLVEGPEQPSPAVAPISYADADLSAPGLLDLPCFQACHTDWSLNTYLSAWQNTDFYWSRYLAKHAVLAVFQLGAMVFIFILIGVFKGTPFAALFTCHLNDSQSGIVYVCMLQTTFIVNMSIISLGFIYLAGLILQLLYFYANFMHSFWIFGKGSEYMGVTSNPTTFIIGVNETKHCFFADYIRLLAYTAFRDSQCEIRALHVNYSPGLYRSDFHFVSLLCRENTHLIPDSIHIHFWIERYARLSRKRFRRPYWAIRRGSLGHLVRCEDLSVKFNFSKIKIRVEVNDMGY